MTTQMTPSAKKMAQLRREVETMQKSRGNRQSFLTFAAMHQSKVHRCRYNELQNLLESTLAVHNGKTVITLENLQYFPAKVHFYYVISNYKIIKHLGMTKGDLMKIAYNYDHAALQNVDAAIPQDVYDKLAKDQRFWYVMDYNGENAVFGKLTDIRDIAERNGVKFVAE